MNSDVIGVGIIGTGFMGRRHLAAYESAVADSLPVRVVALCDRKPADLSAALPAGNLATPGANSGAPDARAYREPDDLLADPAVALVSICTHTDTHVELALRALRAGKHVLVEKPLALRAADIEPLAAAARGAATLCMPAMCMRFWPAWEWLHARIRAGDFGAPRSAVFQRLASPPAWSPEFYRDTSRSGGALVDLHIHDADFIRWCFGEPAAVRSSGSVHHLTTLYDYRDGPAHVMAEGAWDHTPGFPFAMRYVVVFDEATASFDLSRTPQLLLHRNDAGEEVAVSALSGYDGQIRHLLAAITQGRRDLRVTVDDALATARLLERERASLA